MTLKVVTINLLGDLSRWELRRDLLADQLAQLSPDIIMLQEVALPENPANWLAKALSKKLMSEQYQVYVCPKSGSWGKNEGIGLLARNKAAAYECIPLGGQGRVAQKIQLDMNGHTFTLINAHLFWETGPSPEQIRQARKLVDWAEGQSERMPILICGDFNAAPESQTIKLMKESYRSAYEWVHHQEPAFTYPTPLPVSALHQIKTLIRFLPFLHLKTITLNLHNGLDYIFVNDQIEIIDCRLVLDKPHPENKRIYPSDHFGLFAKVMDIQ